MSFCALSESSRMASAEGWIWAGLIAGCAGCAGSVSLYSCPGAGLASSWGLAGGRLVAWGSSPVPTGAAVSSSCSASRFSAGVRAASGGSAQVLFSVTAPLGGKDKYVGSGFTLRRW